MSEEIENRCEALKPGEISRSSIAEDSPSKLLINLRGCEDQCGDWKIDEPFCFRSMLSRSPQKQTEEIGNSEPEKIAELKYRNVYSVSVPNENLAACWNPRRVSTGADRSSRSMELLGVVANLRQESPDASKNTFESDDWLNCLREYLVAYQESNGTPRDEYSFVSLMKAMGQVTGHALVALFYIFVNVSPLIQLLLFILRFVLDKLLSIRRMGYTQQSLTKYAIFGGQLVCIYVCLVFIFGFIVLPIFNLVLAILAKIFLFK